MKATLSKRQAEVLSLLKDSITTEGYAPTLTELMEQLGVSTKRGVAFHLDALEKKGYIYRTGEARGISLIESESDSFISIPILGFANAGTPLVLAEEENIGELTVDKNILKGKKKVFGLEIKGDSMNRKKLNGITMDNGNFALIVKDAQINNGDVVLAVLDGAATIKTFRREGDTVVLYPESNNSVHKPIYIKADDDSFINGKVMTVLSNPAAHTAEV